MKIVYDRADDLMRTLYKCANSEDKLVFGWFVGASVNELKVDRLLDSGTRRAGNDACPDSFGETRDELPARVDKATRFSRPWLVCIFVFHSPILP